MSGRTIDYDALARKAGAISSTAPDVDYDALAKQAGATSSQPSPQSQDWITRSLSKPLPKVDMSKNAPRKDLSNTVRFNTPRSNSQQAFDTLGGAVAAPVQALLTPPQTPEEAAFTASMNPAQAQVFLAFKRMFFDPQAAQWQKANETSGAESAGHRAAALLPVAGPMAAASGESFANGEPTAGMLNAYGAVAAGHGSAPAVERGVKVVIDTAPKVASAVVDAVPSPRGAMAKTMAEKANDSQFTRAEIADAANEHGVNLDLAQTTESPLVNSVKLGNRHSLAASFRYGKNLKSNLAALDEWANGELNNIDSNPMRPESAGYAIQGELEAQKAAFEGRKATSLERDTQAQLDRVGGQSQPREMVGNQMTQALKAHLEARKNAAATIFEDLDNNRGASHIAIDQSVGKEAQNIIGEMSDYYKKYPELVPTKVWKIIDNLSKQKSASWGELHQLRSDIMDVYRNNPELVKGRSDAMLQRMVGSIDNAMTDASSGLSAADLARFREANQIWESIKNTYDNPQSPYYHAIRNGSGTQVISSMESLPPEYIRGLQGSIDANTFTQFQRAYFEKLLDPKGAGSVDFAGLQKRVANMGDAKLKAVFGDNAPAIKRFSERATDISNSEPFGGDPHLNKATETRNPLDVAQILASGGPELARQVKQTIGSLKSQFQRQYVEQLLKDKNGNLDLGKLKNRLEGIRDDQLVAMVGEDTARNLKLLGDVTQRVRQGLVESVTASRMIPKGEMVAIGGSFTNPFVAASTAAELSGQFAVGKAMNSKSVINFLTKPKPKP